MNVELEGGLEDRGLRIEDRSLIGGYPPSSIIYPQSSIFFPLAPRTRRLNTVLAPAGVTDLVRRAFSICSFDGGGACWDGFTCLGSVLEGSPVYATVVDETSAKLNDLGGLFDAGNPRLAAYSRLHREQMNLAMVATRVPDPDHPDLVRQRELCASLRERLPKPASPAAPPAQP